jgi:hypothetical protein
MDIASDSDDLLLGVVDATGALDLELSTGSYEVAQALRQRLRFWLGEWFADPGIGMPYLQRLLGKGVSVGDITSAVRNEVLKDPRVSKVDWIRASIASNRTATCDFQATLADGTTTGAIKVSIP